MAKSRRKSLSEAPPVVDPAGPAAGRAALPSVEAVLTSEPTVEAIGRHGRAVMVACVRETLAQLRAKPAIRPAQTTPPAIARAAAAMAEERPDIKQFALARSSQGCRELSNLLISRTHWTTPNDNGR